MSVYKLNLVPGGTGPDLGLGIKMQKASTGPGGHTVIEQPAACVSIFAGYSIAGNVDTNPGAGPNTAVFQAGATGSFTVTAHGIFCEGDTFDWTSGVMSSGSTTNSVVASVADVDGNPTVTFTWSADMTLDLTNFVHYTLRKNGANWATQFAVTVATPAVSGVDCGTGWAVIPADASGGGGFLISADGSPAFVINPGTGMDLGTTVASDVTWVITQSYQGPNGAATTMPTIAAAGSDVASGFNFNTFASSDPGYVGSVFSAQAQIGGSNVCDPVSLPSAFGIDFISIDNPNYLVSSPWDGTSLGISGGDAFSPCNITFQFNAPPGGSGTLHYSDGSGTGWSTTTTQVDATTFVVALSLDPDTYDGTFSYSFYGQALTAYYPAYTSSPGDTQCSIAFT